MTSQLFRRGALAWERVEAETQLVGDLEAESQIDTQPYEGWLPESQIQAQPYEGFSRLEPMGRGPAWTDEASTNKEASILDFFNAADWSSSVTNTLANPCPLN